MANDLEERIQRIVERIGFMPRTADRSFLAQVPYWARIMAEAEADGGFFPALHQAVPAGFFLEEELILPDLSQRIVGATVAQRKKVLELSKPGTRKTIASLAALVPITEEEGPVRTLITCPGYIIPNWIREIEKLFVEPDIVVITRENRERAILRSQHADFVIVGYDMTFRDAVRNGKLPLGFSDRYFQLLRKLRNPDEAYQHLAGLIGERKAETVFRRDLPLPKLLGLITDAEGYATERGDKGAVLHALQQHAFVPGTPYYVIIDEFHNIVNHTTKRGMAIAEIAREARYLTLISGTGIGNKPEGLSWAAFLLGYVDDPHDFKRYIRTDTERKVRAFIDEFAVHPIRTLKDVDSRIPEPIREEKVYEVTAGEIALFQALLAADQFDGREKYLLFRYLIANPHKLLPEGLDHLAGKDDPLPDRIREFYAANPGLEALVRESIQSRMLFVKELVADIKARGEKCLVACEYQRGVTEILEETLQDLGARRIDQTISPDLQEIRLTEDEKLYLAFCSKTEGDASLFKGDEVFRSDLSSRAKQEIRIEPYEVYGMSERDRIMHEFATDPDIAALVSTRVLREGVELREAKYIIVFEDTTVPCKYEQFNGRTIRSGQHAQTFIWTVRSPVLAVLEAYIQGTRESRQQLIDTIYGGAAPGADEISRWVAGETDAERLGGVLRELSARTILGYHFNWLEGKGSLGYAKALLSGNTAAFVAALYVADWEHTVSGNVAKLTHDLILGIEKRSGAHLDDLLDAASGPLSLARSVQRKVTSIDLSRHMLEYGLDARPGTEVYLGDITDLANLASMDAYAGQVFLPKTRVRRPLAIDDKTKDAVVASLVFDLLDSDGRYRFLREAHRVLKDGKYLVLVIPAKKIDPSCRASFIKDVETCGFTNDAYFTGTYQGFAGADREDVQAYVLVAKKGEYECGDASALQLRPETRIIEGGTVAGNGRKKEKEYRQLSADRFVKVESGLDLAQVEVPYGAEVATLVERAQPDELQAVLDKIRRIVEE